MRFDAGQSLLQLADHSHVWIVAQFPEDQAMYVNVGQKMTVTFPSMPQQKVEGENQLHRSARRRPGAPDHGPNRHFRFRPHVSSRTFAQVSGEVPIGKRITVSSSAVVPTGNKFIVFVDHGGGQLEPREIQVGAHSGDNYEVVSGLKEGDQVVASANFLIDAEPDSRSTQDLGNTPMNPAFLPKRPPA